MRKEAVRAAPYQHNSITQTIIFLYLLDNDTSWLVRGEEARGSKRGRRDEDADAGGLAGSKT